MGGRLKRPKNNLVQELIGKFNPIFENSIGNIDRILKEFLCCRTPKRTIRFLLNNNRVKLGGG